MGQLDSCSYEIDSSPGTEQELGSFEDEPNQRKITDLCAVRPLSSHVGLSIIEEHQLIDIFLC